MFSITERKGFHITFENGVTISVQFGMGNYGDNYDLGQVSHHNYSDPVPPSRTAEVAAWNSNKEWFDFETKQFGKGNPLGRQNPNEVLALMNELASIKTTQQPKDTE